MPTRIVGIGSAVPPLAFTQEEVLSLLDIRDARLRGVFLNGGISRRNLALPEGAATNAYPVESNGQLIARHRRRALALAEEALSTACAHAGVTMADVDFVCCVTSTGFLVPSLSTRLVAESEVPNNAARADIVGMGCNAGLNGMQTAVNWSRSNPGLLAALICVEVCSAAYFDDGSMGSAVVNSLFGDGAAAALLRADDHTDGNDASAASPLVTDFANTIVPDSLSAMSFEWDDGAHKNGFQLSPDIPRTIGAAVPGLVLELLEDADLGVHEVDHWILHAGGKKVVDSVRVNLGLSLYDVRHTLSVLNDHGNLSSASFLFSLQRLNQDPTVQPGDNGVMITMGPGASIESAVVRW
ncbi:3,5-dihydroxyphenylacetyl-CoA synthase DpgA [Curtobacterium flaccumfaciens]|uniref:3,5-dihydroxyphenylacetyl-CoA synthase DpgA n=1 Tax=Curtobacterium flaccumfaciens TaxID=2035 RepID=UPI001BDEEC9C|nr:3,5-dihydroxyphenylacetyl-CoA synthase DpgA [Curtobacterium flaccumfaciens]MBT1672833.1 hypothetical protein [Curtobacterium flaccumfaciens pv. flaccumfaciens]